MPPSSSTISTCIKSCAFTESIRILFFNICVRKSFVNQTFLNCSTYELFRNSKDQQYPFHGFLQWMIIGASTVRKYHWNWHPWVMGDHDILKNVIYHKNVTLYDVCVNHSCTRISWKSLSRKWVGMLILSFVILIIQTNNYVL